jgi:FlaA1/EpsC-like NDP-sugar epimerase
LENFFQLNILKRRFVSKWIILILDMLLIAFSLLVVYTLTRNEYFDSLTLSVYYKGVISVIFFAIIGHLVFAPHKGVIRYTSLFDVQRVFLSRTLAVCLNLGYIFLVAPQIHAQKYTVPILILLTNYVLSLCILILFRLSIKFVFNAGRTNVGKQRIIIFGAGEAGHITYKVLSPSFEVIAFIDDNQLKKGKYYEGIKILHSNDNIKKFVERNSVKQIVISVQNCSTIEKRRIYDRCIEWGLEIKTVPPIEEWVDGELTKGQIRTIKIEDLLGRETIELKDNHLKNSLANKTVLVTGAAGSIGSEIVRQLINIKPACVIMLDQAETPMYHLEIEIDSLQQPIKQIHCEVIIADVKDEQAIEAVFKKFRIDYIFHAAAYKHVPSMEQNPLQAMKVNIYGTKILADLADKYKVERMVLVSTDKAVNPTNIMGATKRAAEMYVQSKNAFSQTAYITTRFGNVLGSNGSVIPLFKKQIEAGGPITVTHPDITRYFMTIPEACQLVLEAGYIGNGGEIFVFDMGESVKIIDLAKKMISLSGLEFEKDIKIEFVGLRPGEKLYEELLNANESVLPTHHKKIMISKVVEIPFHKVNEQLMQLLTNIHQHNDEVKAVKMLKQIVPEFVSKNSIYEALDVHVST